MYGFATNILSWGSGPRPYGDRAVFEVLKCSVLDIAKRMTEFVGKRGRKTVEENKDIVFLEKIGISELRYMHSDVLGANPCGSDLISRMQTVFYARIFSARF